MRVAWKFFKTAMCIEGDVRSELRIGVRSHFVQSERSRDFAGTLEQRAASAVPIRQHGKVFSHFSDPFRHMIFAEYRNKRSGSMFAK
jgi:hypothetical protein